MPDMNGGIYEAVMNEKSIINCNEYVMNLLLHEKATRLLKWCLHRLDH